MLISKHLIGQFTGELDSLCLLFVVSINLEGVVTDCSLVTEIIGTGSVSVLEIT